MGEFTQIPVDPAVLQTGWFGPDPEGFRGDVVLETTRRPEEFEARLGISFQQTFDSLDDLRLAVLALPSGRRCYVEFHEGNPAQTTSLVVVGRSRFNAADAVSELTRVLGLRPAEVTWMRSGWLGPEPPGTYLG